MAKSGSFAAAVDRADWAIGGSTGEGLLVLALLSALVWFAYRRGKSTISAGKSAIPGG